MLPVSEPPYPKIANEPKFHPLIRKSFIFVPSAGMRLAPEILVLELMREVFFTKHFGSSSNPSVGTRDLDPDEFNDEHRYYYSDSERAVLHALRGRRKKSKAAKTQSFYAPAYPQLAEEGWLGKSREHVVINFLLSGPIAQHIWQRGQGTEDAKNYQDELIRKLYLALLGHNSCLGPDLSDKDILAATLGQDSFINYSIPELALQNLKTKTSSQPGILLDIKNDELANRITKDLVALCDLESKLPRMQWIQLLMTFLRFALPMWLLAHMQLTRLVHRWLLAAVDDGWIIQKDEIEKSFAMRNRGLLHPTLTPTRELYEQVEQYMKSRVELNIFLRNLEDVRGNLVKDKILNRDGGGRDWMSIEELFILVRGASDEIKDSERFKRVSEDLDIKTFLTREGEMFAAWRNPLMRGQGKNIDEFFRVLYKAEVGDESGGYLLIPEGRGAKRGFRVFPGQLLLKLVTFLASSDKRESQGSGGGMLVLQDVEYHFAQYGIDFSTAADARPLLMDELTAMGLLTGSPDAGSSVTVASPY